MIKKYIYKNYINNSSDIYSFSKDKEFLQLINNLNKKHYIKVTSNLIHKTDKITQIEQFIFNLDNYITYIKQNIFINQIELKYIINQTIYNKYNKILYSDIYYYDNIDLYINNFKKMFMYNYINNSKALNIKPKNFINFCNTINNHKKRVYCYFELINNNDKHLFNILYNES